jgi:hypothetical protein
MTPRFEIYQLPLGEWTMVRLPKDYQNGDLLPLPKPSDPRFDTQAEAIAAMEERMRMRRAPGSSFPIRRLLSRRG